jgi:RNA polymerase sigma-70 factor (ECF subfamily)
MQVIQGQQADQEIRLDPKKSSDFSKLYKSTSTYLLAIAAKMGISANDRDDMAQQAYVRLLESGATYTLPHAKAYLACAVRSQVIDRSRRAKTRKTDLVEDWSTVDASAPAESGHAKHLDALADALGRLESRGGHLLAMYYRDGMSIEQIRQRIGSKTSSVTSGLARQRQRFLPELRSAVEAIA